MTEIDLTKMGYASPPGEMMQDLVNDEGWTNAEFARRMGCSEKHVSLLLRGKAEITEATAQDLSRVLGMSVGYWVRRESNYRAVLAAHAKEKALAKAVGDWLKELPPYSWLERAGLFRRPETRKGRKIESFLDFFGVNSVDSWRLMYLPNEARFRASTKAKVMPGAVAVWLRACELEAKKVQCEPFDKAGFTRFLKKELRGLTRIEDAGEAMRRVQEACAPFGVAVVSFPNPPKCPLSGATWWTNPHKAVIGLSLRFKTADHFWFSFAHEAGHVLKHSKKERHIAFDGRDDEEEREANDFARDLLIPPKLAIDIPKLKTAEDFVAFAERAGVAPGVVVGRAQHDFGLPHSAFTQLKTKYVWPDRTAKT